MNYADLIAHFGSQSKVARALNVKPPSVHEWKKVGIPQTRQYQIEVVTGGALKADRAPQVVDGAQNGAVAAQEAA